MSRAELKAIELERFKSHSGTSRRDVAPLTVLLGRNNSGKSSLLQALLLLRQTLAHPRSDVPLHLEGSGSGEFAAQMLRSRQQDVVHYMPRCACPPKGPSPFRTSSRLSLEPRQEAHSIVFI